MVAHPGHHDDLEPKLPRRPGHGQEVRGEEPILRDDEDDLLEPQRHEEERQEEEDINNQVQLMTLHAAKGLEWPVVVMESLDREVGARTLMADLGLEPVPAAFNPAVARTLP